MDKNKFVKTVLPIVAVLVLLESVILFSGGNKKVVQLITSKPAPTVPAMTEVEPTFDVLVTADKSTVAVGKKAKVVVRASTLSEKTVDSISLYLKVNPKEFVLSPLTFDSKLPKPAFAKVSESKNLVVVNYMITNPEGLRLTQGENLDLVAFEMTPKVPGEYIIELSTGNESKESATMFVETVTGKVLPFASNSLTINVTK